MITGWRHIIAEKRMGRTKNRTGDPDSQSLKPDPETMETGTFDAQFAGRLNAPSAQDQMNLTAPASVAEDTTRPLVTLEASTPEENQ